MSRRKIIIQVVIGGLTQFLAKAQGMPSNIKNALTKIIWEFIWEDDSSPRITLDLLQQTTKTGGLDLLDIKARNEAIEIMWLKAYLNFSPTRPVWATVTNTIINAAAPPAISKKARSNMYLQFWNAPTKGPRAGLLNKDIIRMMKATKKHDINLAAIRISPHLSTQLPAWYHIFSSKCSLANAPSNCLLHQHHVARVADLVTTSA